MQHNVRRANSKSRQHGIRSGFVLFEYNTVSVIFSFIILAKRKDKQSLRLLRGSERDLKLDIASAQLNSLHDHMIDSHPPLKTPQPSVQIESCKQFKSLCSKPVTCPKKSVEPFIDYTKEEDEEENDCSQDRVEFHKMLSLLIRMGCGDRQVQGRANPRRVVSICKL